MAIEGGAMAISSKGDYVSYPGRSTMFMVFNCVMAASGGLMFGYDLGISGGVSSMDDFLSKFFPKVYRQKHAAETNNYCKFDSQLLTAFTSSLYIAGLIASIFASMITRKYGRRPSMLTGGLCFFAGAALNGGADNVAMLIIGRIMFGVGVGFANQSVPIYLSELAPPKLRGGFNIMFHIAIGFGAVCANLVNYGTGKLTPWGWRLSLGLAAAPASLLTLGSLLLSDTPNSFIERGYLEKGRAVLETVRGTTEVEAEFDALVKASEFSKSVKHPWHSILLRRYRPQLVMAVCIPFFQQLTGINILTFYAPVLFQSIGFGADASLYSAVIIGSVGLVATTLSALFVDRFGRRVLFLEGGCVMFVTQVIVGIILCAEFGGYKTLPHGYAILVVLVICTYVSGYAWSWGPLALLVPSEIFPLEIRSAGQCITVCVNLFCTFVIAQAFLAMLCHMKAGLFFFFGGWVMLMTVFIFKFFPETKNVPIEEMSEVWKQHPYWSQYYV